LFDRKFIFCLWEIQLRKDEFSYVYSFVVVLSQSAFYAGFQHLDIGINSI